MTARDPDPTRLSAEIERLVGPLDDQRWKLLGKAAAELHARFVSDLPPETPRSPYLSDRTTLAAYLAYFFPASKAQVVRALAEVEPPAAPSARVLDVGAGPGPAAQAAAEWLAAHGKSVETVALEASPLALESMAKLWPKELGAVSPKAWRAGQALPAGPFDVVVAAHVLNELFQEESARLDRRATFAVELSKRLAPGGLLVLVEPALKRTGRELLVMRDRLIQQASMYALAPCLTQLPCPAIAKPRDWCHADRPWEAPPLAVRAAEEAGLARESLKFAYVVLTNAPMERVKDAALFRIVSEPLPEKGKLRYFGCGPLGRHPLVRLDRETSEPNAAFSTLERGDIARLDPTVPGADGKRVGAASVVTVVRSAKERD